MSTLVYVGIQSIEIQTYRSNYRRIWTQAPAQHATVLLIYEEKIKIIDQEVGKHVLAVIVV